MVIKGQRIELNITGTLPLTENWNLNLRVSLIAVHRHRTGVGSIPAGGPYS